MVKMVPPTNITYKTYKPPKIVPMMDMMKPALREPLPSYNSGLSLYSFRPLPANTMPIIPKIRPTKKHPKTIEQIPNTSTAVALGKVCFSMSKN